MKAESCKRQVVRSKEDLLYEVQLYIQDTKDELKTLTNRLNDLYAEEHNLIEEIVASERN